MPITVTRSPMLAEEARATAHATAHVVSQITWTVAGVHEGICNTLLRTPLAHVPGAHTLLKGIRGGNQQIARAVDVSAETLAVTGGEIWAQLTSPAATSIHTSPRGSGTTAALGAAIGDTLAAHPRTRPLLPDMSIHHEGQAVTATEFGQGLTSGTQLCFFLHGLGCHEGHWDVSLPATVSAAGYTPVMLRYNTGLTINENGARFAGLLRELHRTVNPHSVMFVGHSMGGLVARRGLEHLEHSNGHNDAAKGLLGKTRALVTLGSPHKGSPVEKGAHLALTGLSQFSPTRALADFGHRRSHGIKDLRHGAIRPEDWGGRHPDSVLSDRTMTRPVPADIPHIAVVAHWSTKPLLTLIVGDGIVREPSARQDGPGTGETVVISQCSHLGLMADPRVAELLAGLSRSDTQPASA